jgi:hypothetical protein
VTGPPQREREPGGRPWPAGSHLGVEERHHPGPTWLLHGGAPNEVAKLTRDQLAMRSVRSPLPMLVTYGRAA